MRRASAFPFIATVLAAIALPSASAQPAGDGLTDLQRNGRQISPSRAASATCRRRSTRARTGRCCPRSSAGGNDEVIRGVISDGTPRMPAFKHYLDRPQIDAVIAYLKTVSAPPAAPATQFG